MDGGWTTWEDWRTCRSPCGGGVQYRHRSCENPKPNFLGSSCNGSSYDQQECNNQTCPGNCSQYFSINDIAPKINFDCHVPPSYAPLFNN